jgi:predicted nucleic acid-binding protein
VIVVDTSALIDSLVGTRRSAPRMRSLIAAGERLVLPTLVLYEWWRGPRLPAELSAQEALFPSDAALPFGVEQATVASRLYGQLPRPRGRELDLAIAAHAISRGARLWTLNTSDFVDLPGLQLVALD